MLLRISRILLLTMGITLILGLILGMMLGAIGAAGMILGPLLGIMTMLLIMITSAAGFVRGRSNWTILNSIEQAVRLNMPMADVVRALAESEGGSRSFELVQASHAIQAGAPVAVVLSSFTQLPQRVIRQVIAAERIGRLPQVLDRIVRNRREAISRKSKNAPFYRIYPVMLLIVFCFVTGVFLTFVAPKLMAIFKDFKIYLPAPTIALLRWSNNAGFWLVLISTLLFLGLVATAVASWWPGTAAGVYEGLGDWIANRLPWVGRFRMYRDLSDALVFIADAIDSGRPLDFSLTEAAQLTNNSPLRERMERWQSEMSLGIPLQAAAKKAGLPRLVYGMLATTSHSGDLSQVLRFLSSYYASRFSRATMLMEASVLPVLAIVMGTLVGWVALSVILPIVKLIDLASPYKVGL